MTRSNENEQAVNLSDQERVAVARDTSQEETRVSQNPSIMKEESKGRTVWDYIAEYRAARRTRPQRNWYRFAFYAILGISVIYIVKTAVSNIDYGVYRISEDVATIRATAEKTSAEIASLTKGLNSAGSFHTHQHDIAGCKGRAVEALQRAEGQSINAEQVSSVYANFLQNGFVHPVVVHCLDDGFVYIYSFGVSKDFNGSIVPKVWELFAKVDEKPPLPAMESEAKPDSPREE